LSLLEAGTKRSVSGDAIGVERELQRAPVVAVDLPGDRTAGGRARRALEPLRPWLGALLYGDVRLLVSELVADEIGTREGKRGPPLRLSASFGERVLRIELVDGWSENEAPAQRPEPGEPGWGLYLAGVLADRWGVEAASEGSLVWLEVLL
jgi:hypothetical protein